MLLLAPIAFVFWLLIIATALTVYIGFYVVIGILFLGAKIIGSSWRPKRRLTRPTMSHPVPQARYSDRH